MTGLKQKHFPCFEYFDSICGWPIQEPRVMSRQKRGCGSMKRQCLLLLITLCAAANAAAASTVADPGRFAPVSGKIRDLIAYWKVPSIAVAVAYKGQVIWEEGFGFSDPESKVPATGQTVYSLASVSKPITATAIMTLVQKGKVRLDDPINRYLGDDKIVARIGNTEDATIRRVANHTAGILPHYKTFDADRGEQVPPSARPFRTLASSSYPRVSGSCTAMWASACSVMRWKPFLEKNCARI
ncbi:MAG TPA: serine hydrolase domain-containing protein [Steroidobacteraceae bacterium]|jgi:CubicO group peptidase (beta-lactamase class C family)